MTWNISTVEHLPPRDLDLKSDREFRQLKQLQKNVVMLTICCDHEGHDHDDNIDCHDDGDSND